MAARRFTQGQRDEMAAMRERGLSYGQIAQKFGCSESTAYWTCLRLGADTAQAPRFHSFDPARATTTRNGHVIRRWSPEEDARLLALEAEGQTHTEIGRALGRKANSVTARLMTLARQEAWKESA